jgi:hypothetical protein
MPNRDGTGPMGQGPGTGRIRGGCTGVNGKRANGACMRPGRGTGNADGNLRPRGIARRGLWKNTVNDAQDE